MTNVVQFNPNRKKSTEPKKKPTPKQQEMNLSNESYYFYIGDEQFNFGGAFRRDMVERGNAKITEVLLNASIFADIQEDILKRIQYKELRFEDEEYTDGAEGLLQFQVMASFKLDMELMVQGTLHLLETGDLENMLEEDNKYYKLVSLILTNLVYTLYTPFDLRRMEKDNWCLCNANPEEIFEFLSQLYTTDEPETQE